MSNRLFVGNLSFNTTEAGFRDFLTAQGLAPSYVKFVTDRDTGRPKGFAFLEFPDASAASAAMKKLADAWLDGRGLRTEIAEPRPQSRGGGGGGGGGGGQRPRPKRNEEQHRDEEPWREERRRKGGRHR